MNTELRKRLEEAAGEYADMVTTTEERGWMDRSDIYTLAKDAYTTGAKFGYKEAIALAKEWLDEHGKLDKLDLVEFDMDMNKLWEEKK